MAKSYRIAVIAGDGIGHEVMPEGIAAMETAARTYGFGFTWNDFDWSCERYRKTGRMMPEDALDRLRLYDAVYLGAVGHPDVPDHISLWGLLIPLRRSFHQYVNLRPVRLLAGVESPLRDRAPGDIDFYVVRENNEGEYSEIGGRLYAGSEYEMAMQEAVFTKRGCDRVMRYAFELARTRKKHVTSATKSNGIIHTMPFWDERFVAVARDYPDVKTDQYHIDILTAHFVRHPTGSTSSSARTSLATSSPISAPPSWGQSVSRHPATSTRSVNTRRCSNRYTVRRPISPGAASPTQSGKSGQAR